MDKNTLTQRLLPLVTSLNWERLEDYLIYERQELLENLAKCSDIKQINKLQGRILQLDVVLKLPELSKKVATS